MPLLDDLLRHARDRPHDPAALDPTRSLDWTGLLEEVAAAATGLAAQDVGPGDRVGLHLPNSVNNFLVAALATWWRGATFVPLDFSSPAARVASLVEDCEPAVVVTAAEDPVAAGLVGPPVPTLAALRSSASPWGPPVTADAPAYLIYTSGTTGAPKGVVIGHAALDAALSALVEIVDVGPSSRAACVSPFHFDGSFGTLFATLHAGGLVTIPTRGEVLFPRNFLRWIDAHAVDLTGFTPTYLRLLAAGRALPALGPGPLRMLAVGGEALSAADVIGLLGAAPQLRVFNRYGPTETTIAVAHHRLHATDLAAGEPVPVGRPHPGSSFHILGDDLQPVPTGTPGELWIGGAQLMDGYWRAPEPTVAVLRSGVVTGDLVYETGDLVRADAEGVVRSPTAASSTSRHFSGGRPSDRYSLGVETLPGRSGATFSPARSEVRWTTRSMT